MIKKIAHLADIHIRKSTSRHQEYREVFNNLYNQLIKDKPDRIVIVGDLFHDYIKLEGELLVLSSEFINSLAEIAPVRITRGNHDVLKSDMQRLDSVDALIKSIKNPNVVFYNQTGFFIDENVVWAVWKYGEKKNNPWDKLDGATDPTKTYIDLYHDPVNGCLSVDGFEFNSRTYRHINDFKGDLSLFGDIHKKQYLTNDKRKAYCGSLIDQNYGEGDNQFHGYLLWDLDTLQAIEVPVANNYGHYSVVVNRFTDFDNLNLEISNPTPHKWIRTIWRTLPAVCDNANKRKVIEYLTKNYQPISINFKSEFIEEEKIEITENSDIENIYQIEVIHRILKEYYEKIGVEESMIEEILNLDTEIKNRIVFEEVTNIQWSIVNLKGKNFRSFNTVDLDFNDKDGIYQITGENGAGKSTLIQLITYILYGETLETKYTAQYKDATYINKANGANSCEGSLVIKCDSLYYGIKRSTTIKRNKKGELIGAPTVVEYYVLTSPDQPLDEHSALETLNETERHATQRKIDEIIGTFSNFIRVTLTTADIMNNILSNERSKFIDAILFDSGMNIFDLRLSEFKNYKKEIKDKGRIVCNDMVEKANIEQHKNNITNYEGKIESLKREIELINDVLTTKQTEKDNLLKRMHPIDVSLQNLNPDIIESNIRTLTYERSGLEIEEKKLTEEIGKLRHEYDKILEEELTHKRDSHKTQEFELRTQIQKHRHQIEQLNSNISRINGDLEIMKRDGAKMKQKIQALNNSKTCPECGQTVEHALEKIKENIIATEKEMYALADTINNRKAEILPITQEIESIKGKITTLENTITNNSLSFQTVLEQLGTISNHKTEIEKRNELVRKKEAIPLKIENINLKITALYKQQEDYNMQETKIEMNKETQLWIDNVNINIRHLESEKQTKLSSIATEEATIKMCKNEIAAKEELLRKFYIQERNDQIMDFYERSIHRDGVPTQILTDRLLPKINNTISMLLENLEFSIWLDPEDLRLKFCYDENPQGIIDAATSSGMERSFGCIALKVALNLINAKSKSTSIFLDEIMGKLKGDRVGDFIDFIKIISKVYNKVFIIEHNHEVNPDYVINVTLEKRISQLTLLEQ